VHKQKQRDISGGGGGEGGGRTEGGGGVLVLDQDQMADLFLVV